VESKGIAIAFALPCGVPFLEEKRLNICKTALINESLGNFSKVFKQNKYFFHHLLLNKAVSIFQKCYLMEILIK